MEYLGSVPHTLQGQLHRNHKALEMDAEFWAFSLLWRGFIVFNLILQGLCDSLAPKKIRSGNYLAGKKPKLNSTGQLWWKPLTSFTLNPVFSTVKPTGQHRTQMLKGFGGGDVLMASGDDRTECLKSYKFDLSVVTDTRIVSKQSFLSSGVLCLLSCPAKSAQGFPCRLAPTTETDLS